MGQDLPREVTGNPVGPRQRTSAPPAGLRILVPGLAQWSWGQHQRGLALFGSFTSALAAALVYWGQTIGWGFLAFAYLTHAVSCLDALRQNSFPFFPRIAAISATLGGLGLLVYAPLLSVLSLYAWIGGIADHSGACYLVNRLAYRHHEPVPGQWIWLRAPRRGLSQAARVVAIAGQEVEWTGRKWRVDGRFLEVNSQRRSPIFPEPWKFRVPDHHVVVDPETEEGTVFSPPLMIVGREEIVGRAWARYYPLWDRCLL